MTDNTSRTRKQMPRQQKQQKSSRATTKNPLQRSLSLLAALGQVHEKLVMTLDPLDHLVLPAIK